MKKTSKNPHIIEALKLKGMSIEGNEVEYTYLFDDTEFKDSLVLPVKPAKNDKFDRFVLLNLGICSLLYYTQYALPKKIVIPFSISRRGRDFWTDFYENFITQKFFLEKIPFKYLPEFIFEGENFSDARKKWKTGNKILAGFSGGKDSLLQTEIFHRSNIKFDFIHLIWEGGDYGRDRDKLYLPIVKKVAKNNKIILLKNKLYKDPSKLFNYRGLVNTIGVTRLALAGVLLSRYKGYEYLAIGNEKSADYGNTVWDGHIINHQYGKSSYHLNKLNRYINRYLTPSFSYFNTFEQWYEIKIMEVFSKLPHLFGISTSCNPAGYQAGKGIKWCCNCYKCAFIYLMARAFMGPKKANEVIGKDLFQRIDLIKPLASFSGVKPMDCVGEKEEVWIALDMCFRRGETSPALDYYKKNILPKIKGGIPKLEKKYLGTYKSHIPPEIWEKMKRGINSIEKI